MKQTASRVIAWIVLVLSLVFFSSTGVLAQDNKKPTIERQGNVFVQKSNSRGSSNVIKTNYIYQDSKGNKDTIYISSTGKCFVFKLSKNGNIYKRYLPEITKQLQEEGKIDEKH